MKENNINRKKLKKHFSQRIFSFGLICFFIIGAGITSYPFISDALARYNSIASIQEYRNYTVSLSKEDLLAEWEKARIYNDNLAGDPVRDPFVPNSGMALPENYTDVLNVQGDGIMGYLEIPSADIQLLIAHGTSEETLKSYVGHIEQTALPIGGAHSHSVLTAHTGLPSAKLFTDLIKVQEGDCFYIYVLDEMMTYQVDQIEVIEPEEVNKLKMVPGQDYVTLLTCTPYGVNSHRLLVRGMRIPNEEVPEEIEESSGSCLWLVLIVLLLIIVLLIIYRKYRKRRKRRLEAGNER